MAEPVHLKPSELSAIDMLITKMSEDNKPVDEPQVLTTPVVTVVAQATIATVAVICVSAPSDAQILDKIKALSSQLQSRASHTQLVELRRQAVAEAAKRK